jgi:hypothetical protein
MRSNKETGLLLGLISGHVDDEEEGRAITRGLPSTVILPGRRAYSSSLHCLSYPDPICKPLHFVSLHSASLSLHLTPHHFYRPTSPP